MNVHVRYEWQMLKACYLALKRLETGKLFIPILISGYGEKENGQFVFNLLHEDFCLHARNLVLWKVDDALSSTNVSITYNMPDNIYHIMKKIKNQIVTLNPEQRTSKTREKLDKEDREELFSHIKDMLEWDES